MITDEFRAEVLKLRDEGWTWPEIAELTGRSQRTCQRVVELNERTCEHRGCDEPVLSDNGRFCTHHAKTRMRNKPGQGEQQRMVMRHMRRLGHATSEELRTVTGLDTSSLGQIASRLVQHGMLERPMKGHYCMPRSPEFTPAAPIGPTPDTIGTHREN